MELVRQLLDPWSARSTSRRAGYCWVCADMLCTPEGLKALETLPGFAHYNMHELLKSVRQGCRLCEIILREGWEHTRYKIAGQLQLSQEDMDKPLRFIWREPTLRNSTGSVNRVFTMYTEQDLEKENRKSRGVKIWLLGGQLTHNKPPEVPREGWTWSSRISIAVMASFGEQHGFSPLHRRGSY